MTASEQRAREAQRCEELAARQDRLGDESNPPIGSHIPHVAALQRSDSRLLAAALKAHASRLRAPETGDQRNILVLGDALGRVLVRLGVIEPSQSLTGPHLLVAAEDWLSTQAAASEPQAEGDTVSDVAPSAGPETSSFASEAQRPVRAEMTTADLLVCLSEIETTLLLSPGSVRDTIAHWRKSCAVLTDADLVERLEKARELLQPIPLATTNGGAWNHDEAQRPAVVPPSDAVVEAVSRALYNATHTEAYREHYPLRSDYRYSEAYGESARAVIAAYEAAHRASAGHTAADAFCVECGRRLPAHLDPCPAALRNEGGNGGQRA